MDTEISPLQQLNPDSILQNPENPRLIFREDDMNQLLMSIRDGGIRVPLSVYQDGSSYVLLDGERRWRCARKLNLPSVPAIVQPKPSALENLLMMFNIHNVRVEWDLMPMALKIGRIKMMLAENGELTTPANLAAVTGVSPSTVRRALELLDMPQKYQDMLLEEAEKPRRQQKITADVFVEVYKAYNVVERYVPEVFEETTKEDFVEALVNKYLSNVVNNVVQYREVSKIARAEKAGADREDVIPNLLRLVTDEDYGITEAYQDTVESAYAQRELTSRIKGVADRLSSYKTARFLTEDGRQELTRLRDEIQRLLGK